MYPSNYDLANNDFHQLAGDCSSETHGHGHSHSGGGCGGGHGHSHGGHGHSHGSTSSSHGHGHGHSHGAGPCNHDHDFDDYEKHSIEIMPNKFLDKTKYDVKSEFVIDGLRYVEYKDERQMPLIMNLITKDLSEPYSIYTYRYFIHNWPFLCFLVIIIKFFY
jgi:hypothetical protein